MVRTRYRIRKKATADTTMPYYNLGQLYEYGYGVSKSIYTAMNYYSQAKYNNSKAKEAYNRLYKEYGDYYSWYY